MLNILQYFPLPPPFYPPHRSLLYIIYNRSAIINSLCLSVTLCLAALIAIRIVWLCILKCILCLFFHSDKALKGLKTIIFEGVESRNFVLEEAHDVQVCTWNQHLEPGKHASIQNYLHFAFLVETVVRSPTSLIRRWYACYTRTLR